MEYAISQSIRYKDLYEREVVPIEELQEIEAEKNAWSERTVQYKSNIEKLSYDIEQTNIRAPFDGYVVSKHTEIGEWLIKGNNVYEMVNLDNVYALVYVPELIAMQLVEGGDAEVTFDAFPGLTIEGTILTVIPQASQNARTFPVKVGIQNKEKKIKIGLLTRVSFFSANENVSKFVHKDAIVEMKGQNFIYTVKDGIASPVPVKTGISQNNMIEVESQLPPGADVIIRGNERVRPGQSVKVVPE